MDFLLLSIFYTRSLDYYDEFIILLWFSENPDFMSIGIEELVVNTSYLFEIVCML